MNISYDCFSDMPNLLQVIDFPITVENIPNHLFYNCSKLSSFSSGDQISKLGTLLISPHVIHIGYASFYKTNFSTIIFPLFYQLPIFDSFAFSDIPNLIEILGFPKFQEIPFRAFSKLPKLSVLTT
jgi:predicted secreted protein